MHALPISINHSAAPVRWDETILDRLDADAGTAMEVAAGFPTDPDRLRNASPGTCSAMFDRFCQRVSDANMWDHELKTSNPVDACSDWHLLVLAVEDVLTHDRLQ